MKITKQDYTLLESSIYDCLEKYNIQYPDFLEHYQNNKVKVMWILYHMSNEQDWHNSDGTINVKNRKVGNRFDFHWYLNDSNIQTALMKIEKDLTTMIYSNDNNGEVFYKRLLSLVGKNIEIQYSDDTGTIGELILLSDNVFSINGNMFTGDDIYKIHEQSIWCV